MTTHFYFDPEADSLEVFLGPTEARLMELAWKHGQLTVKRALMNLGDESPRAYTTIMTVLSRLSKKGLLIRRREGRHYLYYPSQSRELFLKQRISVVQQCFRRNFKKSI